jgi:hypothetical protein
MFSQAVDARPGLEVVYMGKGSAIAVATARSFGGATASRGPVIMVTDTVPVQLGPPAVVHGTASPLPLQQPAPLGLRLHPEALL